MVPEPIRPEELPIPAVVVAGQAVVAWSPDAAELLGLGDPSAPSGPGRAGPVVTGGPELATFVVPADRARLRAVLADPDDSTVELATHLVGPTSRPVTLSLSPARDGRRVVVIRDQTESHRLSALIEALADSTVLVDPAGRLLWQSADPSGPGAPLASLDAHPMERIHPEDLPMVLEAVADLDRRPGGRRSRIVRTRVDAPDPTSARSPDDPESTDRWQLVELVVANRVSHPDLGGVIVQSRALDPVSELAAVGQADAPLRSLAEAAPIGILLMDRLERVLYVNQVGRQLLGHDPAVAARRADDPADQVPDDPDQPDDPGQPDRRDAPGDDWRRGFSGPGRQAVDQLVAAGLLGAEAASTTAAFATPDGRQGSMRLRVAALLDAGGQPAGVFVAMEDVTAEVEARAESERLLQMLDATSDFVAIFRPSGEILHTNAALAQLLADNLAAGGTGRLGDLLEDRVGFIQRGLATVANQDTWHGELQLRITPSRTMPVSALGVVGRDQAGELDWVAMVARDITVQKEAEHRLRSLATTDHLTGLANRVLFTERLAEVVTEAGRIGRSVSVLFCDLDRFKEVNDQHGHAAGDTVLVEIAERLRGIVRAEDFVARVGGDEFVIICGGTDQVEALAGLADRLILAVRRPVALGGPDGPQVRVGISVGVAVSIGGRSDPDRILTVADQAMYRAKATGGNRYRIQPVEPDSVDSSDDERAGDHLDGDEPAGDEPAGDEWAGDGRAADGRAAEEPAGDEPAGDEWAGEAGEGERPGPGEPSDGPRES